MGEHTEVILVHGLWYRAWSLRILRGRLENAGFHLRSFSYPTRTRSFEANAGALKQFASQSQVARQHFVAHSLGGLVTLAMLSRQNELPPGRLVLLGTPMQGSQVARRLVNWPAGGFMLGQAAQVLQQGHPDVAPGRETGMIAGMKSLGLGRLTGRLGHFHDGTVTVEETQSALLDDRIELPVTHTGMLLSHDVALQVASFLRKGHFKRPDLGLR